MYRPIEKPDYGLQVAYEILNEEPRSFAETTAVVKREVLNSGCVVIAFPLGENAHRFARNVNQGPRILR